MLLLEKLCQDATSLLVSDMLDCIYKLKILNLHFYLYENPQQCGTSKMQHIGMNSQGLVQPDKLLLSSEE